MVTVGPGVPARVVPLLQDVLLPAEGPALKRQPPTGGRRAGSLISAALGWGGPMSREGVVPKRC